MDGEGYLILASGPPQYVEMARNLAASLRIMDGTRPICLVHDQHARLEASDKAFFDDAAVLPEDPLYSGSINKIRLHPLSPYRRTMFVDADCLLMKRDIDIYWDVGRKSFFCITGARRTQGRWKGVDIAHLLAQEQSPYLVQMNSGVFCFDKSPAAASFFQGLNDFYLRRRSALGVGLQRGKPGQTDEIYLGLWMGLNGLDDCVGNSGENSWMVTTWRSFGMTLDPERGRTLIRKPKRSTAGIPNPLLGWTRLSPSFVHFIGLKPLRRYEQLSRYFRAQLPAGG